MKVVMILPPQVTVPGFMANALSPGTYSIFVDTQAEVIDLDMHRYLVEHQVPGREGGILQDIGSACSMIALRGKWIYENATSEDLSKLLPWAGSSNVGWNWMRLQVMQMVYRLKFPLFIASDLISTAIMVEDMKFRHKGGEPNVYYYTMTLKEFNPALTVISSIGMGVLQSLIPTTEGVGY